MGDGCSWLDPSPELRRELARCTQVFCDLPYSLEHEGREEAGIGLVPPDADRFSAAEREAVREVELDFNRAYKAELAAIATAAGLPAEGSAEGSPSELARRLQSTLPAIDRVRRRISREKAGLEVERADPEDQLGERYWKLKLESGNVLERELAKVLGPSRARELRGTGWGSSGLSGGPCEEEATQPGTQPGAPN